MLEGSGHGLAAGLINVPSVDARGVDFRNGEGERVFADSNGEFCAAIGSELLGIIEADDAAFGVENYGGRDNRAEERAATGFINAGDARPAELARGTLNTGRAEATNLEKYAIRNARAKSNTRALVI